MSNTLRSYTSISSAANLGHFRETETNVMTELAQQLMYYITPIASLPPRICLYINLTHRY